MVNIHQLILMYLNINILSGFFELYLSGVVLGFIVASQEDKLSCQPQELRNVQNTER